MDRPTVLLLHGFPTSSLMFRNLIPALADEFHLVAPDYPWYGQSSFPAKDEFDYTFERFYEIVLRFVDTLGLERLLDLRPGLRRTHRPQARLAPPRARAGADRPERERIHGGVHAMWEPLFAYAGNRNGETEAPVRSLLTLEAIKWMWTHGTRDPEEHRAGDLDARRATTWSAAATARSSSTSSTTTGSTSEYKKFQQYLREHQPPTLIIWGEGDEIFGPAGAEAYKRDLPDAELHLLDTGHFALEEELEFIADAMRRFLNANVRDAR